MILCVLFILQIKAMQECPYEAHVRNFFGLSEIPDENVRVDSDFGLLVNLICTYERDLKRQLEEEKHAAETWKAMLRMELKRCNGLVSENLKLKKKTEVGELQKAAPALLAHLKDVVAWALDGKDGDIYRPAKAREFIETLEAPNF